MKRILVYITLLCVSLAIASCKRLTPSDAVRIAKVATPEIDERALPVFYKLRLSKTENETAYASGQPERLVVDAFLGRKNISPLPKDGTYVAVELIPDLYVYQRPFDLSLVGVKLRVFVNYYEKGKMVFLPDYRTKIPLDTIKTDLLELCSDLGAKDPQVTIERCSFLNPRPKGRMNRTTSQCTGRSSQ